MKITLHQNDFTVAGWINTLIELGILDYDENLKKEFRNISNEIEDGMDITYIDINVDGIEIN